MLPTFLAPVMGFGFLAGLVLFFGAPLLVAVLMATGRVRYRESVAAVALLVACAFATLGGDFVYNVLHWTQSRPSVSLAAFSCLVLFGSPGGVLAVIFSRTAHRRRWAGPAVVLLSGTAMIVVSEVRSRGQRDLEQRRRSEAAVVGPFTGAFLPVERVRSPADGAIALRGHVGAGVPVTLLTDPLAKLRKIELCTAVTARYIPKDPDPAVLGDVTYLADATHCGSAPGPALGAVGRQAKSVASVPFEDTDAPVSASLFSSPRVAEGWRAGHVPLSEMNLASARVRVATGPRGEKVFVVTLAPLKPAESAYPCTGPGLVLSVGDVASVHAALPPCTLAYNLFTLDDDLFFAARTQTPVPRDSEEMNPDWTEWMFRVTSDGVEQVWPEGGARR